MSGEEEEASVRPRLGPALRFCFYGSDVQAGHPGDIFKAPPGDICGWKLSVLVWFLLRKTISVLSPGGEPPDGLGTDPVGSNMAGIDTSFKSFLCVLSFVWVSLAFFLSPKPHFEPHSFGLALVLCS